MTPDFTADEIEAMACFFHRSYVERRSADEPAGDTRPDWGDLPEAKREANRALAREVARKLRLVGLAMTRGAGDASLSPDQVAALARLEHDRWMQQRQASGRADHRSMMPYDDLSDTEKQKDIDTVLDIPRALAVVGRGITVGRRHRQPRM